jgi:menaquinone-dependent protoporphyrinogen oxidase
MENRVLVGYSSKYGATAEIAEKIGGALRQSGLQVDVLSLKNVKDVAPYNAFVVGSALYMFQWRADATAFLKKNWKKLADKPTWVFSSGPLGKGDPVEMVKDQRFQKTLEPVLAQIKPRSVTVFHGAITMNKLNFLERAMMKRMPDQQGDSRDWNAIDAWAKQIAAELNKQGK